MSNVKCLAEYFNLYAVKLQDGLRASRFSILLFFPLNLMRGVYYFGWFTKADVLVSKKFETFRY